MSDLRDLPGVPRTLSDETGVIRLMRSLREHIRALRGFDGRGENIALSENDIRTIVANEVATLPAGGGGSSGSTTYVPDYTEPPTPTGVVVTAGMSYITTETAVPTFTAGHGYDRTVIYGAQWPAGDPAPTFSAAVPVDEFVGNIGSFPTKMATRWCIWVKWRTKDGVLSTTAAGGANGYQVTTGQDVALLLGVLTNQISASQLAASLSTPISLITAPATTAGSVDARIKAETDARITADASTLSSAQTYTASYAYSKSQTDAQISTYAYSKAQADSAIATQVGTVSARLNAGGDIATAISTEATARANADGHLGALYTVRVQLTEGGRTVMGGFGISGTSSGSAGATIDFGVQANKFWIGAPAGTTGVSDVQPFVVQTTDETVNGVLVPKGVYMDATYIKNLSAMVARLGDAWIDNAMIANLNASKINAGFLSADRVQAGSLDAKIANLDAAVIGSGTFGNARIGGLITSTDFDGTTSGGNKITGVGTKGWAIAKGDGTPGSSKMVIDAAHIRGKLTTSQIQVGAVTTTDFSARDTDSATLNSTFKDFVVQVFPVMTFTGSPRVIWSDINVYVKGLSSSVSSVHIQITYNPVFGNTMSMPDDDERVIAVCNIGGSRFVSETFTKLIALTGATGTLGFTINVTIWLYSSSGSHVSSPMQCGYIAQMASIENKV